MSRGLFYWLWAGWVLYFAVIEGIAVYHMFKKHMNDEWTFTHFVATQMPMDIRIALLAWLVYHFVIVHVQS